MNERIKKLAEQANLLHKQIGPTVETRYMKRKEQDLEEFAQLIVKSVLSNIEDQRFELPDWIVSNVLKDFGVDE